MSPQVRVKNGPNKGHVHKITDQAITLGRDVDCTIQVLDKGASRHHSEIFRIGEMVFIRDLGSRNGTYVNDERVDEELLREGDRVQVGSTVLVFESGGKVTGDTRNIQFSPSDDEDLGSTLELRLDDLAALEATEEDRESANFRAVYQVGKIISSEHDEEILMDKILAYISEQVPADNIYIFLRDEATNNLIPRATWEAEPGKGVQISRTIIKRAVGETRSVLTSDAMSDARFKERDSIIMGQIRSVICVPLLSQDKVVGVLYLHSSRMAQTFMQEDLELMTAVGTQVAIALDNITVSRRQRETFMSAIRTLVALGEMRDPATRGHSERVCTYASAIAGQLELRDRERTSVELAAILHDIGKVAVASDSVPPGEDPDSRHPELGAKISENIAGMDGVAEAIHSHHELHDGSGYPDELGGDDIPLYGKIIGVANKFDHLTTHGGEKREGLSMKEALITVGEMSGETFDPKVVKALLVAHREGTLFTPPLIFESGKVR